uniref:RRM domain-containing protein n=1 Tax=Kalanchoe fedtschenkoi TaxID=63787 RepID=A0A7N0TNL3_KALFE
MDPDHGKLFVGGIAWGTTSDQLREYFGRYGEVSNASIVKDKITGQPRGFGFVSFSDASVLDHVLQIKHVVGDKTVEVKQALLRAELNPSAKFSNTKVGRSPGAEGHFRTKKIFVGGLPATLTEDEFRQYFGSYGLLTDVVIMYDQNTRRPRGFGFISFETEDSVDRVLSKTFHELNGKLVEVKRAQPKDSYPLGSGRSSDVHGRGIQFYGPPNVNINRSSGHNASNKFPNLQNTLNGFPPTYGYGAVGNYGFCGLGGYFVGRYALGAPMGAYQPPFVPIGYVSNSYGAGPAPTSHFPNGVGYGNQAYGHGSSIRSGISSFNGHSNVRAQPSNVSNISGGANQGKRGVNHDDLRSNNSKDAGQEINTLSGQASAKDSNCH